MGVTGKSNQSSNQYQIPPYEDAGSSEAILSQYMMAMQMSLANQAAISEAALMQDSYNNTPAIYSVGDTDWTEKNNQLAAKARADYGTSEAARKGRSDTVLTSPLLDDSDPNVIGINLGT